MKVSTKSVGIIAIFVLGIFSMTQGAILERTLSINPAGYYVATLVLFFLGGYLAVKKTGHIGSFGFKF